MLILEGVKKMKLLFGVQSRDLNLKNIQDWSIIFMLKVIIVILLRGSAFITA
jgi:hypothetical protein